MVPGLLRWLVFIPRKKRKPTITKTKVIINPALENVNGINASDQISNINSRVIQRHLQRKTVVPVNTAANNHGKNKKQI
jgi:hypothetical protein